MTLLKTHMKLYTLSNVIAFQPTFVLLHKLHEKLTLAQMDPNYLSSCFWLPTFPYKCLEQSKDFKILYLNQSKNFRVLRNKMWLQKWFGSIVFRFVAFIDYCHAVSKHKLKVPLPLVDFVHLWSVLARVIRHQEVWI